MARKPFKYDISLIRDAAKHRWPEILSRLGGVDISLLDEKHHPCPKCGGHDRFRLFPDKSGGALCNQCFRDKNGDGLAVLQWLTGSDFSKTLAEVADYLGISPDTNSRATNRNVDPAEHLEILEWNESLAALWCLNKQPITPDAIRQGHGCFARYRKQYTVIALPIFGLKLAFAKPVGWVIYNATGGNLPKGAKHNRTWTKVKLTYGSKQGVLMSHTWNTPEDIQQHPELIWKVEGPTDLLALIASGLPGGHTAFANSNGSTERPLSWIVDLFAGKRVNIVHDADQPGEDGATFVTGSDGRRRPGWAPCIASKAAECRHIRLPYEIRPDHGPDLRDWLNDGHSYADLLQLAQEAEIVSPIDLPTEDQDNPQTETATLLVDEAVDDPHRLGRVFIRRYAWHESDENTLKFWREEWWKWDGRCYRPLNEKELKANINFVVKQEFDQTYQDALKSNRDDEERAVRKVNAAVGQQRSRSRRRFVRRTRPGQPTLVDRRRPRSQPQLHRDAEWRPKARRPVVGRGRRPAATHAEVVFVRLPAVLVRRGR